MADLAGKVVSIGIGPRRYLVVFGDLNTDRVIAVEPVDTLAEGDELIDAAMQEWRKVGRSDVGEP